MNTPLLLIISGASGVGKSTISHKLLKMWKTPIILETFDLIREAIRGYSKAQMLYLSNDNNPQLIEFLNNSSYNLQLKDFIQQCEILMPALLNVCTRLENKKIPAIIEGVNLDPITILSSSITKNYFILRENTIFLNLHISNRTMYSQQLISKKNHINKLNIEKNLIRSNELYDRLEKFIINNPNYRNIYNIDISDYKTMSRYDNPIINKIISII